MKKTGSFLPVQKPKVSGSFNSHELKNSKQEILNMKNKLNNKERNTIK